MKSTTKARKVQTKAVGTLPPADPAAATNLPKSHTASQPVSAFIASPADTVTKSATHRKDMPPALQQDERLKRPLSKHALPFARKRSGGPRTSEGRASAALNAIKHGGYVTEKSAGVDYQHILSELISRLNPKNVLEDGLVSSLALEMYRLSMLSKLELERVQAAMHTELHPLELSNALGFPFERTHLEALRSPPEFETLQSRAAQFLSTHRDSLGEALCTSSSENAECYLASITKALEALSTHSLEAGDEPEYIFLVDDYVAALLSSLPAQETKIQSSLLQPFVDYWLMRNYLRIELTRRELQVSQVVQLLSSEHVRRARSNSHNSILEIQGLLVALRDGDLLSSDARQSKRL